MVYSAIYSWKSDIIMKCHFSLAGIWFYTAHSTCRFVQIVYFFNRSPNDKFECSYPLIDANANKGAAVIPMSLLLAKAVMTKSIRNILNYIRSKLSGQSAQNLHVIHKTPLRMYTRQSYQDSLHKGTAYSKHLQLE